MFIFRILDIRIQDLFRVEDMGTIGSITRVFIILLVTVVAIPSGASADWREFIPRPYENGVDLDALAVYESDTYKTNTSNSKWSDLYIKERLTLYSDGYVYHPRFMQYHLSLSGSLKEEDFTSTSTSVGWSTLSSIEYDARMFFLPKHPYNLYLFAYRNEPLVKEQTAQFLHNVLTGRGAIFKYQQKPYFFDVSYTDENIQSSLDSTNVNTLAASGTYFKEYQYGNLLTLGASYNHTDFSSLSQQNGDLNAYSLFNTIDIKPVSLNSGLTKETSSQSNLSSSSISSDHLSLQERLTVKLPLNFRTELTYWYQKNNYTAGATGSLPETALFSTDKRLVLNVFHTLFQSLDNIYTFSRDSLKSSSGGVSGDTNNTLNSLTTTYRKIIPWGRLLAGTNVSRAVTDSSGQTASINEPHSASPVPGSFVLNVQLADPTSIQVFLKSPLPPFDLILLEENIHYTVTPFGNTFQINVITLPVQFIVPGTFDFIVTYLSLTGNYKLQMDTFGYNVTVNLFNDMVTPYFNSTVTKSKVLSGFFPGIPVDSTSYIAGLILWKDPFRVLGEYQRFDANINPYRKWKGELTYARAITETSSVRAVATYEDAFYPQGSGIIASQAYSISTATFVGNILKQFPRQNLSVSGGGSYAYSWGLTKGPFYSLMTNLSWKIGKLVVALGANVYGSNLESTAVSPSLKTKRLHEYYYLNIKRKLF